MVPAEYETPPKQVMGSPGDYGRPASSEYAHHREPVYYHPDYAYYPAYYLATQRYQPVHQPAGQDWSQPN